MGVVNVNVKARIINLEQAMRKATELSSLIQKARVMADELENICENITIDFVQEAERYVD